MREFTHPGGKVSERVHDETVLVQFDGSGNVWAMSNDHVGTSVDNLVSKPVVK